MGRSLSGMVTTRAPRATRESLWHRWPEWIGYVAGGWSLVYGAIILGVYWAVGRRGFPFGEGDPQAALSVLNGLTAAAGAPIIAVLGLVGSVVAIAMARGWGRGQLRPVLLAFAWVAAVALALVIPDYRGLMGVAYAFVFLIGAPFGWPPANFFDSVTWPVINQFLCISGGVIWAATAVAYQRRGGDEIAAPTRAAGWTTPVAAARWGRWAAAVAVIIPLLYAATRWAWALGIPLGISDELYQEGRETGLWWAGAALATVAIGGAILTLGLVQRWGEVFPRWAPFLAGKRVPPALAIVPASFVAILVTSAGLMFVRLTLLNSFTDLFSFIDPEDWAALAPELLWPFWGFALGAATLAYYLRRRGEDGLSSSNVLKMDRRRDR